MKRYAAIAALAAIIASGCSSTVPKSFKVFADPPDAEIRVISGLELKELKFSSPAVITTSVPKDPALANKAILEVSKESYKPFTVAIRDIREGQTLNVKLEKIIQKLARYRLTYRLSSPVTSDLLKFADETIAVSFTVSDQAIQMRLTNLRDRAVKILWDQAQFTDVNNQTSRLMHTGVRYQDRNNPIPEQVVPPRGALEEGVLPVNRVVFSQQKKAYDVQPLFPLDTEAAAQLKGKSINVFIPLEVDRTIIPYNFKIQITDSVKEEVKG